MTAAAAELAALRADVAAMRERLDAVLRTAGRFYDAGWEDALSGAPRREGRQPRQLASVTPIRGEGR